MHIIAGMGIDDGHTDFMMFYTDMGIPPNCVLTPKNNASEIRAAFMTFSQSAVRASQTAHGGGGFSSSVAGGFGG